MAEEMGIITVVEVTKVEIMRLTMALAQQVVAHQLEPVVLQL